MTPVLAAFWAKVNKSGDCWIWTGGRSTLGHGHRMVGDNLIYTAQGWRMCRECRRARSRANNAKRRAAQLAANLRPVTQGEPDDRRAIKGLALGAGGELGPHAPMSAPSSLPSTPT